MKINFIKYLFFMTLSLSAINAFPQGSGKILVTVNGEKITSGQLDQWVSAVVAGGGKDTPELRQSLLNELIIQDAIAQDVKKTGLLAKGSNTFKLKLAEKNVIMDMWFAQYLIDHPIMESEIKAEYDRQVAISKEPRNGKEYQLSQIVFATEADANQAIKQLKGGASFAELAKDKSIDKASAVNGGLLGWVLPSQLAPPLNELIPTLSKDDVTLKPIHMGNVWHLVKVDNVKPFVMPGFDQTKGNIANGMAQQRRQEAIKQLIKSVKITQGK